MTGVADIRCEACLALLGPTMGRHKCPRCGLRINLAVACAGEGIERAADPLAALSALALGPAPVRLRLVNADSPIARLFRSPRRLFTPRALLHLAERSGCWLEGLKASGPSAWQPILHAMPRSSPPPSSGDPISLVVLCCKDDLDRARALVTTLAPGFAETVVLYDGARPPDVSWPAGLRCFARPLRGDFAAQRNAGVQMTTQPWVLHVDPDEEPSAAMLSALPQLVAFAARHGFTVLGIPRQNWIDGKLSDVYPDYQYRLHRRDQAWKRRVHEVPEARLKHWRLVWDAMPGNAHLVHYLTCQSLANKASFYESLVDGAGRTTGIQELLGGRQ